NMFRTRSNITKLKKSIATVEATSVPKTQPSQSRSTATMPRGATGSSDRLSPDSTSSPKSSSSAPNTSSASSSSSPINSSETSTGSSSSAVTASSSSRAAAPRVGMSAVTSYPESSSSSRVMTLVASTSPDSPNTSPDP